MKTIAKILTMLVFILPAPLPAETFPDIDIEKIAAERKAIVEDYMQLSEQESAVFWPLYNEYDKMLQTSFSRYKTLIKDYMQTHEHLSDKKAKEMMTELLAIQADDLKHKQTYAKKFSDKLPPKRVFQYFVLEEQFAAGFFATITENLPPIK
jgi:hypothetical protein